jgi:hypothetical protein
VEEALVPLERKPYVSEEEHLAHCLLVRFDVVYERNTCHNLGFLSGDRLCLFQIGICT